MIYSLNGFFSHITLLDVTVAINPNQINNPKCIPVLTFTACTKFSNTANIYAVNKHITNMKK